MLRQRRAVSDSSLALWYDNILHTPTAYFLPKPRFGHLSKESKSLFRWLVAVRGNGLDAHLDTGPASTQGQKYKCVCVCSVCDRVHT